MTQIPAVNLMPASYRAVRRQRRRIRQWMAAGCAYALLLLALWVGARVTWGSPDRALAAALQRVDAQLAEAAHAIKRLQPRLAEARTTLAASQSVGSQPDWSVLLNLLAHRLGESAVLTSCEVEPVRRKVLTGPLSAPSKPVDAEALAAEGRQQAYRLRLSGLSRSQAAVSGFVLRLEQTQLFESVKLIDTRMEPFGNAEAVGFRVECQLGAVHSEPTTTEGATP